MTFILDSKTKNKKNRKFLALLQYMIMLKNIAFVYHASIRSHTPLVLPVS